MNWGSKTFSLEGRHIYRNYFEYTLKYIFSFQLKICAEVSQFLRSSYSHGASRMLGAEVNQNSRKLETYFSNVCLLRSRLKTAPASILITIFFLNLEALEIIGHCIGDSHLPLPLVCCEFMESRKVESVGSVFEHPEATQHWVVGKQLDFLFWAFQ